MPSQKFWTTPVTGKQQNLNPNSAGTELSSYCGFCRSNIRPLSPTRWHSKNTYLSSTGMLGAEPICFPTQQLIL